MFYFHLICHCLWWRGRSLQDIWNVFFEVPARSTFGRGSTCSGNGYALPLTRSVSVVQVTSRFFCTASVACVSCSRDRWSAQLHVYFIAYRTLGRWSGNADNGEAEGRSAICVVEAGWHGFLRSGTIAWVFRDSFKRGERRGSRCGDFGEKKEGLFVDWGRRWF